MPATETATLRTRSRARTKSLLPAMTACALAIGLTACTSSGPKTAPPPTTSATPAVTATTPPPTAAPSPTADPNPADLAALPANEIDASFVTIENFFKAYAHGLATGDRTQYSELYTADCETCRTLDVNISLVRERGDRARGGEIKIWRSEMLSSAAPGRIAWLLEVELAPLHVDRADGSTFDDKGFQGRMHVEVAPNPNGGSRFAVSGIDTDPVDR